MGMGWSNQRLLEELIEAAGGHAVGKGLPDLRDGAEECLNGFRFKRGSEDYGHKGEKGETSVQFRRKRRLRIRFVPTSVPFIHEHDARPSLFFDEPGNFGVLLRESLDPVKE